MEGGVGRAVRTRCDSVIALRFLQLAGLLNIIAVLKELESVVRLLFVGLYRVHRDCVLLASHSIVICNFQGRPVSHRRTTGD